MSGGTIGMSGIPYVPTAEEIERARLEGLAAYEAHKRGIVVPNYNPAGNTNAAMSKHPAGNANEEAVTVPAYHPEINPVNNNLHNPGVVNSNAPQWNPNYPEYDPANLLIGDPRNPANLSVGDMSDPTFPYTIDTPKRSLADAIAAAKNKKV